VAGTFSRRFYPMKFEGGRLLRLVVAGALAAFAGRILPELPPLAGVLVRGLTTVVVFGGLLWILGFLRPTERAFLRQVVGRGWRRKARREAAGQDDTVQ
jgi:hypothetical protein